MRAAPFLMVQVFVSVTIIKTKVQLALCDVHAHFVEFFCTLQTLKWLCTPVAYATSAEAFAVLHEHKQSISVAQKMIK